MANISLLSRLVGGVQRQVDLSANTLVVGSLSTGTNTLTDTILGRLLSLQNGSDVGTSYHTHDTVYTRTTALASTTGGSAGSTLIGDDNSYSHFTPTSATVKGALSGIDSALAGISGSTFSDASFRIYNSTTNTKQIAFDASAISASTTRTISMPDSNVNLGLIATAIQSNGSVAFTAAQSMGGFKLTNLANPSVSGDAVNLGYANATYVPLSEVGAANGVASLDSGGKVPISQLPSALMEYQGAWDASTNTPTLADGTGRNGDVYRVSVAGTQNLGSGSVTYFVGDFVIYNGSIWQRSPAADGVISVNGQSGAVTVNAINQLTGDVTAGPASGSASAVATISAGAVTATKLGTVTDGVTLDQAGAGSTLEIKSGGVGTTQLANASVTAAKLGAVTDGVTLDQSGSGSTLEIKAAGVSATQLATGAFDQSTIVGGAGTPASVVSSPALKLSAVAGQSFSANTSYAVRFGLPQNGETASRIYAADITTSSFDLFYVIGMVMSTSAISAGQSMVVTSLGSFTLGSSDTPFATNDQGKAVFLAASGAFSVTAPSTAGQAVTRIGIVSTTTSIFVQPASVGVN